MQKSSCIILGEFIMKKIFITIALLFGMVVSSYALTISTGGYFNLGGNDSSRIENNGFSSGFGFLFNIDLFSGFGFQSEINLTTSIINIEENQIVFSDLAAIVDIPFMFWWNGKFGFLGVGAGAGINFSLNDCYSEFVKFGISAGANVIFYFNDHIGLLVGATGVFDFPGQISWETDYSDNKTYVGFTDELWKRNNIYGKVGIVYRF